MVVTRRHRYCSSTTSPLYRGKASRGKAEMALETLQHLVQTLVAHGDRPTIVALGKEDAKAWSFAALVGHARRLASGLTAAGLPHGAHVALFAPNRPEW